MFYVVFFPHSVCFVVFVLESQVEQFTSATISIALWNWIIPKTKDESLTSKFVNILSTRGVSLLWDSLIAISARFFLAYVCVFKKQVKLRFA